MKYNSTSFSFACSKMFYKHREIINHLQLQEVCRKFFSSWNIDDTHNSGIFTCSYCASKKHKQCSVAPDTQRKTQLTTKLKNQFKCDFYLKYSKMNFNIPKKHIIYYKVRITQWNFDHTHPLSTKFYIRSITSSKGSEKMDLKAFNHALELLKVDPRLNNGVLRKMIYNLMPPGFLLDSCFLRNFKLRAAIYHAKHPDSTSINTRAAKNMLSQTNFKRQEIQTR